MANLANIIKNINPPIELTSMQYGNLTEQQKNGGNVFYVRGGNGKKQVAATTFAQNNFLSSPKESNVQVELNNINDNINNIILGNHQPYPNTAKYLQPPHDTAYHMDSYGNLIHNQDSTADSFAIMDGYGGGHSRLNFYFQTGGCRVRQLNTGGYQRICYGIGDILEPGQIRTGGYVSNSKKTIVCTLPIFTCADTAKITKLTINAFSSTGSAALWMKYGSSVVTLDGCTIWNNSAQAYANSISSLVATIRPSGWVEIRINFVNPLYINSAGTTECTNNIPIGLWINPIITFS